MPASTSKWAHRTQKTWTMGTNALSAAAFGALFLIILTQVFFRYILNSPLSWTQEIAAILFVWIVCVGSATIVREREHVTFSLIYAAVPPRVRRVMAFSGTAFVVLIMIATFYGNFDFVTFSFRQKTPTLRLPMSVVFGAFSVFMALIIINGIIRLYRLTRDTWELEP